MAYALCSTHSDGSIHFWNFANGTVRQTIKPHGAHWVNDVAFSVDGLRLASVGNDKKVIITDLESMSTVVTMTTPTAPYRVEWIPGTNNILSAEPNQIKIMNPNVVPPASHDVLNIPTSNSGESAMIYVPNKVLAWNYAKSLAVCDGSLKNNSPTYHRGQSGHIRSIAMSPDASLLASGSNNNTAIIRDRKGKILTCFYGSKKPVLALSFSPDGKFLLTTSGTDILVWDAANIQLPTYGRPPTTTTTTPTTATAPATTTTPATTTVPSTTTTATPSTTTTPATTTATASTTATTASASTTTAATPTTSTPSTTTTPATTTATPSTTTTPATTVPAAPPPNPFLPTGLPALPKALSKIPAGNCVNKLSGHTGQVTTMAFSPDGKYLVSGSDTGEVIAWDWSAGGKLVSKFTTPSKYNTRSVRFSAAHLHRRRIVSKIVTFGRLALDGRRASDEQFTVAYLLQRTLYPNLGLVSRHLMENALLVASDRRTLGWTSDEVFSVVFDDKHRWQPYDENKESEMLKSGVVSFERKKKVESTKTENSETTSTTTATASSKAEQTT